MSLSWEWTVYPSVCLCGFPLLTWLLRDCKIFNVSTVWVTLGCLKKFFQYLDGGIERGDKMLKNARYPMSICQLTKIGQVEICLLLELFCSIFLNLYDYGINANFFLSLSVLKNISKILSTCCLGTISADFLCSHNICSN